MMSECSTLVQRVADEVIRRLLPYLKGEPVDVPEYLTLQEAAELTGFSYDFVYDAVRQGDLLAIKKGRAWRAKAADVRAWMGRDRGGQVLPSRPELQEKVSRLLPRLAR
jgi:excisionase family DNA binding protein